MPEAFSDVGSARRRDGLTPCWTLLYYIEIHNFFEPPKKKRTYDGV
jgi:hypothetical protein